MGGFGSAIAEVVSGECPVPVKMVGVKDRFGLSGEADELFKYFGLTADDIVKAAKEAIKLKKR
jgi:transketolase